MEPKEEYHDPDYPEIDSSAQLGRQVLTDEEKVQKIKTIVQREFAEELELKKQEADKIDDQMISARRLLHRLRYALVNNYYRSQKLQLTPAQIQDDVGAQTEPRAKDEASLLLRAEQRRIHPSLRKLLGKKSVDFDEIFKFRTLRNKVRKDYVAMASLKNVTVPAEGNLKSLRPDTKISDGDERSIVKNPACEETAQSWKPKKLPRHLEPSINKKIVKLDEVARNQQKHRYRIIIGNTSKYVPPASAADRSTHKWLLYVRGPQRSPDLSAIVTSVVVRLHDTYAPHHIVTLDKPPFHISRRGWGEFPAKIELHFAFPARNRPASVEHTIKLDRNYTGVQTLGAETIVDVWLYSDEDMLKYEFIEDSPTKPQNAPKEPQTRSKPPTEPQLPTQPQYSPPQPQSETNEQSESWMNFFKRESTEVDVDQMLIRPIKKEPTDIENLIHSNHIDKMPTIKQEVNDFGAITVKSEPTENFIKNDVMCEIPDEITNRTSPKKRIMKYMDPSTGKVYYLEMDVSLDISKVQEIVINSKGNTQTAVITPIKNGVKPKKPPKKGGVSLLKPELQSLLKTENPKKSILKQNHNFTHIQNDHCYLGTSWGKTVSFDASVLPAPPTYKHGVAASENEKCKNGQVLYENLCAAARRMTSCRAAVNYMFRKIDLISGMAGDADFSRRFPFVVEDEQKYWKLDFVKRRHIEWSRAKLINRILTEHTRTTERIWRTKQILIYGRLHGYVVARRDNKVAEETCDDWSSWYDLEQTRKLESNIRGTYPDPACLTSLTRFRDGDYGIQDGGDASVSLTDTSDEEIDVSSVARPPVRIKPEEPQIRESLQVLPVDEEDSLRFLFVERVCSEIGIELRNEDIGNGHSYSAVHAVLLCAMKRFAEEILRSSLAAARSEATQTEGPALVWTHEWPDRQLVRLQHAVAAIRGSRRLSMVAGSGLATAPHTPYAI